MDLHVIAWERYAAALRDLTDQMTRLADIDLHPALLLHAAQRMTAAADLLRELADAAALPGGEVAQAPPAGTEHRWN